jgi:hypothetical protein
MERETQAIPNEVPLPIRYVQQQTKQYLPSILRKLTIILFLFVLLVIILNYSCMLEIYN